MKCFEHKCQLDSLSQKMIPATEKYTRTKNLWLVTIFKKSMTKSLPPTMTTKNLRISFFKMKQSLKIVLTKSCQNQPKVKFLQPLADTDISIIITCLQRICVGHLEIVKYLVSISPTFLIAVFYTKLIWKAFSQHTVWLCNF